MKSRNINDLTTERAQTQMTKLGLSGASTFSLGIYFRETFHYVRVYVEASILGSYTLGRGRLADFVRGK